VWRPPFSRPEIQLGGHVEERAIAFYTRRTDVCNTLIPARVDLLSAHQAVLGRTISSVVSGQQHRVDARNACSHIREAARAERPSLIRMTFTGIAGDAGPTHPDRFRFSTGTWNAVLA